MADYTVVVVVVVVVIVPRPLEFFLHTHYVAYFESLYFTLKLAYYECLA